MLGTNVAERKRLGVFITLLSLVLTTAAVGIYFKHYFVVLVFGVWLAIEFVLLQFTTYLRENGPKKFPKLAELLSLYNRSDESSETLLMEKMQEVRFEGSLTEEERRWLERLKDLIELRGLAFGKPGHGKRLLYQVLLPRKLPQDLDVAQFQHFTTNAIAESASHVADLLWKLYYISMGEVPDLTPIARKLLADLLPGSPERARKILEQWTDCLQREGGIVLLVLHLLNEGAIAPARKLTERILKEDLSVDEEVASGLYWMGEVLWFSERNDEPLGFESAMRYLYHLCFTDPGRGGIFEIDSPFYGEFEAINELAKEAFLFRETLIDRVLVLFETYSGFQDSFGLVLENLTGEVRKNRGDFAGWLRYWERVREGFGQEHLHLVEGNLSFASGRWLAASQSYNEALLLSPDMRAASINLLFCYGKLGDRINLEKHTESIIQNRHFVPALFSSIANAYILLGDEKTADQYYQELAGVPGWADKVDYYRSSFCLSQGLNEKALVFAKRAVEMTPRDSSVLLHLSLCHNALGEKEPALRTLLKVEEEESKDWMQYYRFTLERDSGLREEAKETLLHLTPEYFEDPSELEAALEFARNEKDFRLIRHLRNR